MCLLLWYGYHFPSSSPTIGPLTRHPCLWALEPNYPCLTESHREVIVLRKFGSRSADFLQRVYPSDPHPPCRKPVPVTQSYRARPGYQDAFILFNIRGRRSSSACERARFPRRKHSMTGCARQSWRVALVRCIGHTSPSPRRVLFPGNVVPRRNVTLEEVTCGSVTGPSDRSDSGDPNRVKWSNCGDEAHPGDSLGATPASPCPSPTRNISNTVVSCIVIYGEMAFGRSCQR